MNYNYDGDLPVPLPEGKDDRKVAELLMAVSLWLFNRPSASQVEELQAKLQELLTG